MLSKKRFLASLHVNTVYVYMYMYMYMYIYIYICMEGCARQQLTYCCQVVNHDFASDIAALACALVADGSFQTLCHTNSMVFFDYLASLRLPTS